MATEVGETRTSVAPSKPRRLTDRSEAVMDIGPTPREQYSRRISRAVLPGVNIRPLLVPIARARLGVEQGGRDPAPGIGGIDHLVDLEIGRGAERLAAGIGRRHHLVEQRTALGRVGHRLELLAVAELYRALQSHAAELAGRPGDGEG